MRVHAPGKTPATKQPRDTGRMLQQAVHHPSSSSHRQADPAPGQAIETRTRGIQAKTFTANCPG